VNLPEPSVPASSREPSAGPPTDDSSKSTDPHQGSGGSSLGGYWDANAGGYWQHVPDYHLGLPIALGGGLDHASSYAWIPTYRRSSPGQPPAPEGAARAPGRSSESPGRPLRVVYLGPCLARGGAEIWLTDLLRFLDPGRLQVLRAVVTDPHKIERGYAGAFPLPIESGTDAVLQAVDECDVLLSWGVRLGPLLDGRRPPLSIFIAHGDGWFTRDLVEANVAHLDHVVAVSGRVRDLACNGTPATVIPNGVDTARLAWTLPREEVRRGLGFAHGDFVLGYLGRLAPEKRVDLVLRAVATLPDRFKVLVVGWGPMLPYLQDLAGLHLPNRACFVTAAEYLGDYYRAMDAFCTPGDSEGTPLTMLEAMHCEVPVLVTSVGAVPELIQDRVNGIVVSQDPGSISTAATLLAENPHWSRGLAAQGRATADRTGHASRVARDLEQLLARLWLDKFGNGSPVTSTR
jgi:glycosyltransferase involved in cell wall biosynthesis